MHIDGQNHAFQHCSASSISRTITSIKHLADHIHTGHRRPVQKIPAPLIAAVMIIRATGCAVRFEATICVAITFFAVEITVILDIIGISLDVKLVVAGCDKEHAGIDDLGQK